MKLKSSQQAIKDFLESNPDMEGKVVYLNKQSAKNTLSKIKKARGGTKSSDSYSIIRIDESNNINTKLD